MPPGNHVQTSPGVEPNSTWKKVERYIFNRAIFNINHNIVYTSQHCIPDKRSNSSITKRCSRSKMCGLWQDRAVTANFYVKYRDVHCMDHWSLMTLLRRRCVAALHGRSYPCAACVVSILNVLSVMTDESHTIIEWRTALCRFDWSPGTED